VSLKKQLKRKEQETLFGEYKKIGFRVERLGSIIQNSMVLSKEDADGWLKEVDQRKAELDELVEATIKSIGFTLIK